MSRIKTGMRKFLVLALASCVVFTKPTKAYAETESTYTTYNYDQWEDWAIKSPDAYEFKGKYGINELRVPSFVTPVDIFVDKDLDIYIIDSGDSQLIVLDKDFRLKKAVGMFWNPEKDYPPIDGIDQLRSPTAVFVTDDKRIYVADTENNRIVEFDEQYHYVREILTPQSDILGPDYSFKPIGIVLDSANRIYVMSKNDNEGILELSPEGNFIGYYGAQSVKRNILDWFRTLFMTDEQKARIAKTIPRTYSSMSIDDKDFIWLTSNSMDHWDRYDYMKSKASEKAVIKRMNPSGQDVLARNAKFAPGGDVTMPPSVIVDVAVKNNGLYTLLDDSYNKIFTYDTKGNLLYAFGGVGKQDGVMTRASAVAYLGDDILVLDQEDSVIVRYTMTEYGRALEDAIVADINRDFDSSIVHWTKVVGMNQNLSLAYKAMGDNYLKNKDYKLAMENYRYAGDKEGYSKAFQYMRTDYVKKHFLLVILVPSVAIAIWIYLMGRVKKANKKLYAVGSRHTLGDELLYAFRTIYHPFDGFWEIKKEKRGSVRAATVIVACVLATYFYKAMGTAYLFRSVDVEYVDVIQEFLNVLIPLLLWCLASWGMTTLFSGKGSLKDIYVMTAYSMVPVILMNIPVTIASNFLVNAEKDFLTFFVTLGYAWMLILIFFGSMVIHDYTFNKTAIMAVVSIVGMGAMLFLTMLFVTLGQKIISFIGVIYEEIVMRL